MASDSPLWNERSTDLVPLTVGLIGRSHDWVTMQEHVLPERLQDFLKTLRQRPSWSNGWFGFHYTPISVLTALTSEVDAQAAEVAMHWHVPFPRDAQDADENPQLHRCQVLVAVPEQMYPPETRRDWRWQIAEVRTPTELHEMWARCQPVQQALLDSNTALADWAKAQVARFLTLHSELLLALVQPPPADSPTPDDVTQRTIDFHGWGLPHPFCPRAGELDPVEPRPVFFLPPMGDVPPPRRVLRDYRNRFYRLNELNRDIVQRREDWLPVLQGEMTLLKGFPRNERGRMRRQQMCAVETIADEATPAEQQLFTAAAVSDWLAQFFERQTARSQLGLSIALALAAALYASAHLWPGAKAWWYAMFGLYALSLAAAIGFYLRTYFTGLHARSLEYRGLAEALRIDLFWRIANVSGSVPDSFLRLQRDELTWLRQALRSIHLQLLVRPGWIHAARADKPGPPRTPERGIEIATQCWAMGQRDDHITAVERYKGRNQRYLLAFWLAVGLPVSVLLLFAAGMLIAWPNLAATSMTHVERALVLLGIVPVIGFLVGRYRAERHVAERMQRAQRLAPVYHRACYLLQRFWGSAGTVTQRELDYAREVIGALGRDSLAENGDWLVYKRLRPLKALWIDWEAQPPRLLPDGAAGSPYHAPVVPAYAGPIMPSPVLEDVSPLPPT